MLPLIFPGAFRFTRSAEGATAPVATVGGRHERRFTASELMRYVLKAKEKVKFYINW